MNLSSVGKDASPQMAVGIPQRADLRKLERSCLN
jgi:hypothetical protein